MEKTLKRHAKGLKLDKNTKLITEIITIINLSEIEIRYCH